MRNFMFVFTCIAILNNCCIERTIIAFIAILKRLGRTTFAFIANSHRKNLILQRTIHTKRNKQ